MPEFGHCEKIHEADSSKKWMAEKLSDQPKNRPKNGQKGVHFDE